jgi:hypothetical protein
MSLLSRLESKFRRFAIPNLTVILIAGQILMFVASSAPAGMEQAPAVHAIKLQPEKVMQGEVWRLVTYLFDPPAKNLIFAFFGWYLFYLFGTTLESVWGTFRYNVYLLSGYLSSLAMTFVGWFALGTTGESATNLFLYGTVFLAFARLYPEFVLYIFFVLPVKIRWLAMLQWFVYGVTLVAGPGWLTRLMVLAAVFNYLLFFGVEIWQNAKHGHRRMQFRARSLRRPSKIIHKCHVCGRNSDAEPLVQFRYCSRCEGDLCYCPDHVQNHQHVGNADNQSLSA